MPGLLICLCGVLGHLAPVHQCVCLACCVACMVSWATWSLFSRVYAWCVAQCVRCPGPLGSCSPVCPLGVLCGVGGAFGQMALVHRGANSAWYSALVVSWATWLLFSGVQARRVVLRVQCPGQLGSCSLVCTLGVLRCACGVLGHLAPVHRCVRSACCVACAVFCATWLLFTGVHARAFVLRVRFPGRLGSCSPVCKLRVLFCGCGVLGHLAPVRRCVRLLCCVACAVSWATWLLLTGVHAGRVVLRVRCPKPLVSCSLVCTLPCCVACAVSSATWLLFTGLPALCVVLCVWCPGSLGSCLRVCCYGFEQQQRSRHAICNRSRNRTAACEYICSIKMPVA